MSRHSNLVFEYSKITEQIFIGTNQCCETHFKQELLKRSIKADISLEAKRLDLPFGVDYYLWLPVKNHFPPSQNQFRIGIKFLDELIKNREKIYVHCEHGHGRAPTFVAAYFIYKGMTLKQAMAFLKRKRKGTHFTKQQLNGLKNFIKSLKKSAIIKTKGRLKMTT